MRRTIGLVCLSGALAWAQDPAKVAGSQYRLIAENEDVRLLEVNLAPGAKTVMHSHPDLMVVMLQPGDTKWTMPDGKTVQSQPGTKRGTVIAMDAQTHISENAGKAAVRAVLVEFKKPAPAAAAAKKASSAPSCKVVGESAHATAQLCGGAPGSVTAKHTHFASVVYVALTDINAEITDGTGKMHPLAMKKDTAVITAPETHSAKNTGTAAYQLIVMDLK